MTKKKQTDKLFSSSQSSNFFDDISEDLKSEIKDFSKDTTEESSKKSLKETEESLFSADSPSSAELNELDKAFDVDEDSPSPSEDLPPSPEKEEEMPDKDVDTQNSEEATEKAQASTGELEEALLEAEDIASDSAPEDIPSEMEENPVVVVQQGSKERGESSLQREPFVPSEVGQVISVDSGSYTLIHQSSILDERIEWDASYLEEGETTPSPVKLVELSTYAYRAGYQNFPIARDNLAVIDPSMIIEADERVFIAYHRLPGYRLSERIRNEQHHWTIQQLQQLLHVLGETIDIIHQSGHLFLQLGDSTIWIDPERMPFFTEVEQIYTKRTPYHLLPLIEGYSAPEIYHQDIPLGPYTDVFSLGMLLHYMISKCAPVNHLDLNAPTIPSPRIYQLDFPVGLDAVIFRATNADPALRYQSVSEFLYELDRSISEIAARHRSPRQALHLNIGYDIHIGVNKGQRNPTNQDALFWQYNKQQHKGFFIVADGVSHCNYGSGDRASSILVGAARKHWNEFVKEEDFKKPTSGMQRRRFIQDIFQTANATIAREVNETYDRVEGYVEDVMGSTCVVAFLDANEVTIANLGDSRVYLKTPHYIEQVNVDHDYKTAQLQMGCDLRSIQSLMGGSLITRCVGSCRKDENQKVIPLELQPDFFDLRLMKNDILLLCSDGLTDYAGTTEAETRETISKILDIHEESISACFWLVALANQRGGGDNISLIELKVLDTMPMI